MFATPDDVGGERKRRPPHERHESRASIRPGNSCAHGSGLTQDAGWSRYPMRLPSRGMKTSPHRRAAVAAAMLAALLLFPSPASAVTTATLVNTVDTSVCTPASPDPMRLAYKKTTNQLIVVDSEVEEITRAAFHNVNAWLTTRAREGKKTGETTGFS